MDGGAPATAVRANGERRRTTTPSLRSVAGTLLRAPARYNAFLAAIARTDFFDGDDDGDGDGDDDRDESGRGGEGRETVDSGLGRRAAPRDDPRRRRRGRRRRCRPTVLTEVFPPAFAKYAISSAVSDVLRYALLTSAVGVAKSDLPLVVGAVDAFCAVCDVLVRWNGSWDAFKSNAVGRASGPRTAAAVYGAGVFVVVASALVLGCGAGEEEEAGTKSLPPPPRAGEEGGCRTHRQALLFFALGSYLTKLGHGLIWNVWTQTFKRHAEMRMNAASSRAARDEEERAEEDDETTTSSPRRRLLPSSLDVQGKLSQLQVLLRYAASSVAPPLAACLLFVTGATLSYVVVGLCFVWLSVSVARTVSRIGEEEEGGSADSTGGGRRSSSSSSSREDPPVSARGGVGVGGGGVHRRVSWSEMLPARATSRFRRRPDDGTAEEATSLIPRGDGDGGGTAGRFGPAFFQLGPFLSLTEVVRGGYSRILCLRAATSDLSHADLSRALSAAGTVALLSSWTSDLADEDRRLSASIGFAVLATGHFGLAASSSMVGFVASAAVFGLGEGISTGLRALLKQDFLHEGGPLGGLTGRDMNGRRLRRQVCNKIGIWTDVTLIMNSLIVGVVGHFLGMRVASMVFGSVGLYAVYFSCNRLPDTKPT